MNKTTNYPGIDYAAGTGANQDTKTGIRYGVIPSQDIACGAFDKIVNNGTDEDWLAFIAEAKNQLRHALSDYFSDTKWNDRTTSKLDDAVERAFESVSDSIGDNYEGTGDCTRYSYDSDGYKLQVASDGDIFVIDSPFFTYAQFCSPCAPGACYLLSPLDSRTEANRCYCLGHDWFDSDSPCPYPVYSVATGELVQPNQD